MFTSTLATFPAMTPVFFDLTETMALAIPIIAIITPFLFVLGYVLIIARRESYKRKLQHDTMRTLIDKGQPIPPELLAAQERPKKWDDRRSGLILLATGVALYVLIWQVGLVDNDPDVLAGRWVSLIPGLIGVALLGNWFLTRKDR